MNLFKKISAYWAGRFGCTNMDAKFPPSKVYKYDDKQIDSFISGLISASEDEGEYYRFTHPSMVMLTNLQKIVKDAGYKAEITDTYYLDIYKSIG